MKKYLVCIPTFNGGALFKRSTLALLEAVECDSVLVIDSGSSDGSLEFAHSVGVNVVQIKNEEFNHGGTRNLALKYTGDAEVVVFLTQDAVLADDNAVFNLIKVFDDDRVAAACGRQLPHENANPIAAHARYFNYSDTKRIVGLHNKQKWGIKSVFLSNSFSAYRISALKEIGGFPSDTILCEDMYAAAKFILSGQLVVYEPNSAVQHSHNYTSWHEFQRYFDIGVFHSDEPWIKTSFNGLKSEGLRFFISELSFICRHDPRYILKSILMTASKIAGMSLGRRYRILPSQAVKYLSMHTNYWTNRN